MAKEIKFFSKVTNGKLAEGVSVTIRDLFRRMEGKNLVISIKEHEDTRSKAQNDYYWVAAVPLVAKVFTRLSGYAWTDPDEVHAEIQANILGHRKTMISPITNERYFTYETSTIRKKKEWCDNMMIIAAWLAGKGEYLQDPNEYLSAPSWIDEQPKEYRV
jgi:hypothetical protein